MAAAPRQTAPPSSTEATRASRATGQKENDYRKPSKVEKEGKEECCLSSARPSMSETLGALEQKRALSKDAARRVLRCVEAGDCGSAFSTLLQSISVLHDENTLLWASLHMVVHDRGPLCLCDAEKVARRANCRLCTQRFGPTLGKAVVAKGGGGAKKSAVSDSPPTNNKNKIKHSQRPASPPPASTTRRREKKRPRVCSPPPSFPQRLTFLDEFAEDTTADGGATGGRGEGIALSSAGVVMSSSASMLPGSQEQSRQDFQQQNHRFFYSSDDDRLFCFRHLPPEPPEQPHHLLEEEDVEYSSSMFATLPETHPSFSSLSAEAVLV